MTDRTIAGTRLAIALAVALTTACATATSRSRVQPQDVVVQLVQFHGAVAAQYEAGGMELEHYNAVTKWIGDEIRVLTTNPQQWEGQARLDWVRVRSIVVPFEALGPSVQRLDALLQ